MNWESQVSTENSTEFHTTNNSKNSQTKDLNQIFTKPIESEMETKDIIARKPFASVLKSHYSSHEQIGERKIEMSEREGGRFQKKILSWPQDY